MAVSITQKKLVIAQKKIENPVKFTKKAEQPVNNPSLVLYEGYVIQINLSYSEVRYGCPGCNTTNHFRDKCFYCDRCGKKLSDYNWKLSEKKILECLELSSHAYCHVKYDSIMSIFDIRHISYASCGLRNPFSFILDRNHFHLDNLHSILRSFNNHVRQPEVKTFFVSEADHDRFMAIKTEVTKSPFQGKQL